MVFIFSKIEIKHLLYNTHLLNKSLRELQKPIVFIDAATALANANTIPTEAPNSGPNDREIM